MSSSSQVAADLRFIFDAMPLTGLLHLQANRDRLVRRQYCTTDGRGCLMYLLTEQLPREQRIDSKKALMRFFGGDPDAPRYQPPRWIVRLWDGDICDQVRDRYGDVPRLDEETVFTVLEEVISERLADEQRNQTERDGIGLQPVVAPHAGAMPQDASPARPDKRTQPVPVASFAT